MFSTLSPVIPIIWFLTVLAAIPRARVLSSPSRIFSMTVRFPLLLEWANLPTLVVGEAGWPARRVDLRGCFPFFGAICQSMPIDKTGLPSSDGADAQALIFSVSMTAQRHVLCWITLCSRTAFRFIAFDSNFTKTDIRQIPQTERMLRKPMKIIDSATNQIRGQSGICIAQIFPNAVGLRTTR